MYGPHDPLPAEVLDALRRGNMLEAIVQLRARGVGFQDAVRRVRDHMKSAPPHVAAKDARATRALPPDAARALARGDKIEAIKLVRAESGLGLKEAKDWVEARSPVTRLPTGLSPGEVPHHEGGLLWLVVAIAVAAVAYVLYLHYA